MAVVLGLIAAMLIGTSDFLGARAAGRASALQNTTAAFLGGACAASLYSPLLGSPSARDLGLGALSGVMLAVGLTTLWRAYAVANIGVAAPLAAVVSAVLPVLVDAARGEAPGPVGWLGVAVGVTALVLASWETGASGASGGNRLGVTLGVGSGVFLGGMYLVSVEASDASGTWPVVSQRATACALALIASAAMRTRPLGALAPARWSFAGGMLGASGVAAIVYGGQRYPLAPVVVSGAMYPAFAIALAWVFLHQHLSRRQILGLAAALVGVALIALD